MGKLSSPKVEKRFHVREETLAVMAGRVSGKFNVVLRWSTLLSEDAVDDNVRTI